MINNEMTSKFFDEWLNKSNSIDEFLNSKVTVKLKKNMKPKIDIDKLDKINLSNECKFVYIDSCYLLEG